ncbi:MAG TPA: histidine kinase [Acidimicrobiia bacterium]|nr:histidine kinase [Acidimicrobiia bacterium]
MGELTDSGYEVRGSQLSDETSANTAIGWALALASLAYGAATSSLIFGPALLINYAGSSTLAAALDLTAGLGLIIAGSVALALRRQGAIGPIALLLGVTWLAADWVGWHGGSPIVRSVAMVAVPFVLPLIVHVVAVWPVGTPGLAKLRPAVGLVYGAAAVFTVGRALLRDPFFDLNCWNNCTDNVFLLTHIPQAVRLLDATWYVIAVAAGIGSASVAVGRLLNTSRVGKRALLPVVLPAAFVALTEAARPLAVMALPLGNRAAPLFRALFIIEALSLIAIAGGVMASTVRARQVSHTVSRIAKELGDAAAPGSLATSLSRSLGDPDLRVVYWLPESGRLVDSEGRPTEPPTRDRAVTAIVRGGKTVAMVIHDRGLVGADDLARRIGAAAKLAVDNERLRAELLAQVEDLKTSRVRVVEAADAARLRLERDLHDGAQQRVLALLYEFQLAAKNAASRGDDRTNNLLEGAVIDVQTALAELRDIAHGIYPVVLTEAGLAGALGSLRNTAAIPVEVKSSLNGQVPYQIGSAAFVVAAESVADAAQRGASYATINTSVGGGWLVLEVKDDGSNRRIPMIHLADRVGALGGRFVAEPRIVRAELPCG